MARFFVNRCSRRLRLGFCISRWRFCARDSVSSHIFKRLGVKVAFNRGCRFGQRDFLVFEFKCLGAFSVFLLAFGLLSVPYARCLWRRRDGFSSRHCIGRYFLRRDSLCLRRLLWLSKVLLLCAFCFGLLYSFCNAFIYKRFLEVISQPVSGRVLSGTSKSHFSRAGYRPDSLHQRFQHRGLVSARRF